MGKKAFSLQQSSVIRKTNALVGSTPSMHARFNSSIARRVASFAASGSPVFRNARS